MDDTIDSDCVTASEERRQKKQMVKLYRDRRILWDPHDPDYKNIRKKNAAWKDIAVILNMNVDKAKHAMTILRTQFSSEVKRATRRSLDDPEGMPSKWWLFNEMQFLLTRYDSDHVIGNGGAAEEVDEQDNDIGEYQSKIGHLQTEFESPAGSSDRSSAQASQVESAGRAVPRTYSSVSVVYPSNWSTVKRERASVPISMNSTQSMNSVVRLHASPKTVPDADDDFERFGKFVAAELRKIPEWKMKAVKRRITCALFDDDDDLPPPSVSVTASASASSSSRRHQTCFVSRTKVTAATAEPDVAAQYEVAEVEYE